MRLSPLAVIAAIVFCTGFLAAPPLLAQEQEQESTEPLEEELPEVTIFKRADDTVTEFRLRGKLYMIKVTPENGPEYYLIDREGKGQWVRDDSARKLAVPTWVLTTW
ncbi:MAG: DUF2782 domain-containing protein [Azoarcus sp.]|jgi:hypothetical protein|nr:DUF2782 domain-containing protein [Azoarcus sp.]